MDLGEAGRPADDIQLVVVDLASNCLRAVFDEQPDDLEVAVLRGEMQRKRVVAFVADVRVRAAREQRSNDRLVADTEMQRGSESDVPGQRGAFVDDVGMTPRGSIRRRRRRRSRQPSTTLVSPARAVTATRC